MKNKNSNPAVKEASPDPGDWEEVKNLGNVMVNETR